MRAVPQRFRGTKIGRLLDGWWRGGLDDATIAGFEAGIIADRLASR